MKKIDWNSVKSANNPTIARMLTVSMVVFNALDIGEASDILRISAKPLRLLSWWCFANRNIKVFVSTANPTLIVGGIDKSIAIQS